MMAEALMKYETIDRYQIDDIMAGKEPRPPKNWGTVVLPEASRLKSLSRRLG